MLPCVPCATYMRRRDPDSFVLLSGSDYPVATADTILSELRTGRYDAYLDFRESAIQDRSRRLWIIGRLTTILAIPMVLLAYDAM